MTERMAGYSPANGTTEAVLEGLARMSATQADALCDRQIAYAIDRWQLSDATEWHRMKLRLRWRRAMQARGMEPTTGC